MYSACCYCCCLLTLLFQRASPLNIALHAQAKYLEHGWVAGSEITTAGIKRALDKHGDHNVVVFAPFSYVGLDEIQWDFVITEGYIGSVPAFIRRIRSLSPEVKIVHYCLDTYPTLQHIMTLDVDGFLTNSRVLLPKLASLAPTSYVPLAADPDTMRPLDQDDPSFYDKTKYSNHTVVYLGHNSATKPTLHRMLREILNHNLIIYGNNWNLAPEDLKARWRGILPLNDVAELYRYCVTIAVCLSNLGQHLSDLCFFPFSSLSLSLSLSLSILPLNKFGAHCVGHNRRKTTEAGHDQQSCLRDTGLRESFN